jgi:hypothetical protein
VTDGEFNYLDIFEFANPPRFFEFANPMLTPLIETDPCSDPRMCA